MANTIVLNAANIDLSGRIAYSTTVVASPALAAETVIGSVVVPGGLQYALGVLVIGYAAYTVGTSGVSVDLKLRQTSVSGTTVGDTGATTDTAAHLNSRSVWGFDTSPPAGGVYKLTMQVASGAAASTVSGVMLLVVAV